MLFNSYGFIFLFLPLSLVLFYALRMNLPYRAGLLWLLGSSLFFYGYGNVWYLVLLLFSIIVNWEIAVFLSKEKYRQALLAAGISFNVLLLCYFKYGSFIFNTGLNIQHHDLLLPVGMSFYTFQQIAFLVDTYREPASRCSLANYGLFVSFFPKLLAGPIVRPKEMLPQLVRKPLSPVRDDLAVGITLFVFGLCKKLMIADLFGTYANPVFNTVAQGGIVNIYNCWVGVLSYTFQIYYDFSGYSDMAIGLGRMFGIHLPLNFHSPYKATNMVDFWRRWHITLSRFLRDYIYIPLGGNRHGQWRLMGNLLITMLIGGIWHGNSWNFLWWGGWHGVGLVVTHGWQRLVSPNLPTQKENHLSGLLAWGITFFYIALGWVLFRSENMEVAYAIYKTLFAVDKIVLPAEWSSLALFSTWTASFYGSFSRTPLAHLFLAFCLTMYTPNTQELLRDYIKENTFAASRGLKWKPSLPWTAFVTILFLAALASMSSVSEFLYFQY